MGNLLIPGPSNPLLSPIQPPLQILSNCTKNSGTYTEVHQVTKKSTRTIFIPSSSLKYFLSSTPASGKENQLIPKFSHSQDSKLNIMELMSSLILYSSCSLSEKVHLSFEVFDFDKNEVITKDEMVILCLSFLKGAAIMTQTAFFSKKIMKKLADEAFILADSNPDGEITKNELEEWINSNEVLSSLFNRGKLPEIKKRKSILESQGFEVNQRENFLLKISKVQVKPSKTNRKTRTISRKIKKTALSNRNDGDLESISFFNDSRDRRNNEILEKIIKSKFFAVSKSNPLQRNLQGSLKISKKPAFKPFEIDSNFLKKLFIRYDLNNDGFVSLKEMKLVLREKLSNEAIQMIFEEYDSDNDGLLSFEDFYKLFTPNSKPM